MPSGKFGRCRETWRNTYDVLAAPLFLIRSAARPVTQGYAGAEPRCMIAAVTPSDGNGPIRRVPPLSTRAKRTSPLGVSLLQTVTGGQQLSLEEKAFKRLVDPDASGP
jgi:hypothetical protein